MTFDEARAQYTVLAHTAYLNAGSNGPLAQATIEAVVASQRADLERGRSGGEYVERLHELRERVRQQLAALLGVGADAVALTASTTNGCHAVLAGLELSPEDEIVTTDEEHFGLLGPVHASGARIRVARTRDFPVSRALGSILAEVGPRTRLLALSHVSWMTGNVLPVEELKRETALPILVDGAQSAGAVPVDASIFDFYTVSAQKWLCGPDSTGALVVADPERLRVAAPSYSSQQRYSEDGSFEPRPGARRFDFGYVSTASLAGLEAALFAAPPWRFERAREAAERCRARLADRVEVVTDPGQATLVTFRPAEDAATLVARLYEQGVVVRAIPGTGWIRASCGYWTSDEDIDRLLAGLDRAS